MGLDWVLNKSKPKDGFVSEYMDLSEKIKNTEDRGELTRLEKRIDEISIKAFEIIGAPKIGENESANNYFRERIYRPNREQAIKRLKRDPSDQWAKHWSRSLREVMDDHLGKYISDLATDNRGFSMYSGMLCSSIDFRGKMVCCIDDLSDELKNEGYEDHEDPIHALEYSKKLKEAAPLLAGQDRRVVESAVSWMDFWGNRGYGFYAWY